jgi:hypothetical protein
MQFGAEHRGVQHHCIPKSVSRRSALVIARLHRSAAS